MRTEGFICDNCNKKVESKEMPVNWLELKNKRTDVTGIASWVKTWHFCSSSCLVGKYTANPEFIRTDV